MQQPLDARVREIYAEYEAVRRTYQLYPDNNDATVAAYRATADALRWREKQMHVVDEYYAELAVTQAPSPTLIMTLSETLQETFLPIYNLVATIDGGAYGVTGPSVSEGFLSVTRRTTLANDVFSQIGGEAAVHMNGGAPLGQPPRPQQQPAAPRAGPADGQVGPAVAFPEFPGGEAQLRAETQFHNQVYKLVPGWRTAAAVCVALDRAKRAAGQQITYGMNPNLVIYEVDYANHNTKSVYLPTHSLLYASTVPGFLDICYAVMRTAPIVGVNARGGAADAVGFVEFADYDFGPQFEPRGWIYGDDPPFVLVGDEPMVRILEDYNYLFPIPTDPAFRIHIPWRLQFLKRFYDINRHTEQPFGLFVNEFYDQVVSAIAVGHRPEDIKHTLLQMQQHMGRGLRCDSYVAFYARVFLTAITDGTTGLRFPVSENVDTQSHVDMDDKVPWKTVLQARFTDDAAESDAGVPDMPLTLPLPYAPITNDGGGVADQGYGIQTHLVSRILLRGVSREFESLPAFSEGIFHYFAWTDTVNGWVDQIAQAYNREHRQMLLHTKSVTPIDVLGGRCIPAVTGTTRVSPNARMSLALSSRSYSNSLCICSSPNLWTLNVKSDTNASKFIFPDITSDDLGREHAFEVNYALTGLVIGGSAGDEKDFRQVTYVQPPLAGAAGPAAGPAAPVVNIDMNAAGNAMFRFRGTDVLHSVYESPTYAAPCALDVNTWRSKDESVLRVVEQPVILSAVQEALAIVKRCMLLPAGPGEIPLRFWDVCRAGIRGKIGADGFYTGDNDDVTVQFAALASALITRARAHTNGKSRNDLSVVQLTTATIEDLKRTFSRLVFVPDNTTNGRHLELMPAATPQRPVKRTRAVYENEEEIEYEYFDRDQQLQQVRDQLQRRLRAPGRLGPRAGFYI